MRAIKLPQLEGGGIGPRPESCVNWWGGPIDMVSCFHQGNLYSKRNLRVWRDQKGIRRVGSKTILTCAGCQTNPSQGRQYRVENEKFRKMEWTYRHGTVFAPRQYLYQKEATVMERPEMYSASRWNNPTYLCGLSNYPISIDAV